MMRTLTKQKIIVYLSEKKQTSPGKLVSFLGISRQALFKQLKQLLDEEKIVKEGAAPKVLYSLKKKTNLIEIAWAWITNLSALSPEEDWFCQTRDSFSGRLEIFLSKLEPEKNDAYLLTALVGEIGNNSFDHNLGNWPDLSGTFFAYDLEGKTIVLADRGQGVFKTLSRVLPEIKTDRQALEAAFTKIVSGRSPERRGNGLKFVKQVITEKNWFLQFSSGGALLEIKDKKLILKKTKVFVHGCLAVIKY